MSSESCRAIVIGASAGCVGALCVILPALPKPYPFPVMVVVHLPADKKNAMAELFQAKCALRVKEAQDKEPIVPGTVYFAPPDYHMLVEKEKILSLSSEEPVLFSRPSIDVLFETASDAYGSALIGVILTGASSDGANGLKAVAESGGVALVQRPDLSYAGVMPQAAINACPQAKALSLEQIALYLQKAASL